MKSRRSSLGSFGNLRGLNYQIFDETVYEDDWEKLEADFRSMEKARLEHRDHLEQISSSEKNLASAVKAYTSGLTKLQSRVKSDGVLSPEKQSKALSLIKDKHKSVREASHCLPQKNSIVLGLALGDINVTLPKINDRVRYKANYENFKLKITFIGFIFTAINICLASPHRIIESLFHTFLVWYYSTITLREHILVANGSRIRPWWLWHHYLSIAILALLLIWPDGSAYTAFYPQFNNFMLYAGFIQLLQFKYQTKRLYTLRALGKADVMDITAEGLQWNNLSLLIPFLLFGQLWQLYIAKILFDLSLAEGCVEWQVPVIGILFVWLGCGNLFTTVTTCYRKFFAPKLQTPKEDANGLEEPVQRSVR